MNDRPGVTPTPEDGTSSGLRNRIGAMVLGAAFAFLAGAIILVPRLEEKRRADPDNTRQVALGKSVYDQRCAACHGARLEGQPDWQERLPSGRMPAPPHDSSGHTWHHPDSVLFGITKRGLVPGAYAPPGYESDMPAFGQALSDDEIWAVLAYIKASWPRDIRIAQHEMTRERDRR